MLSLALVLGCPYNNIAVLGPVFGLEVYLGPGLELQVLG